MVQEAAEEVNAHLASPPPPTTNAVEAPSIDAAEAHRVPLAAEQDLAQRAAKMAKTQGDKLVLPALAAPMARVTANAPLSTKT